MISSFNKEVIVEKRVSFKAGIWLGWSFGKKTEPGYKTSQAKIKRAQLGCEPSRTIL
jgi:hypothetical protein